MRPLTLHSSALNDAEYAVYIACLRDLAEDEPNMQASDAFCENMNVGVREARAWLRGRYSSLAPGMIDSVRLFMNVPAAALTTVDCCRSSAFSAQALHPPTSSQAASSLLF